MWMSRHSPTKRQLVTLEAVFPGHTLIRDTRSFDTASEIVKRFKESGADEIVVVAPLTVVRELVKRGLKPIHAEMEHIKCSDSEVETRIKNRCYRFIRFTRINSINVDSTPLTQEETK